MSGNLISTYLELRISYEYDTGINEDIGGMTLHSATNKATCKLGEACP